MISIDTETTGLDLRHGAKPYFVTSCNDEGEVSFWEWDVDPLTRQPVISEADLREIGDLVFGAAGDDGPEVVMQNGKFDVTALATVLPPFSWPWAKTVDTLLAAHLLESNAPHDLTAIALRWLDKDIRPWEDALKEEVQAARRLARSKFPEWRIGKRGLEEMPSAKEKVWPADGWLPRALARHLEVRDDHLWWTVLRDYANVDAEVTRAVWPVMEKEIRRRGLWEIYLSQLPLLEIGYGMECRGLTYSQGRLIEARKVHRAASVESARACLDIAEGLGYPLELPGGSNNKSMTEFCFGRDKVEDLDFSGERPTYDPAVGARREEWLRLPPVKFTEKGSPSLDKESFTHWLETLDPESVQHRFVKALSDKRKRDTALTFLDSYERFGRPMVVEQEVANGRKNDGSSFSSGTMKMVTYGEWHLLHPWLNLTGTDTLRFSMQNPNAQQISKQELANLRHCFGPAPGRELWSGDFENVELRIPTYEAGEEELIAVFDRPKEPPFYGSYHMVVFAALWPELWEDAIGKVGIEKAASYCKTEYESTFYQWTKNFDFSVIYGCQEAKGDATAHKRGAWRANRDRFPKIAALSDRQKRLADKHGYVETMPDRTVNPRRGYPLLCARGPWGKVSPTIPLNYHVSGTACWIMRRAMVKAEVLLREWRADGFDGHMVLNVHDEAVFDLPRGTGKEPWRTNLPRMRAVKAAMESCGDDVGVPTPVSIEWHGETWAVGKKI